MKINLDLKFKYKVVFYYNLIVVFEGEDVSMYINMPICIEKCIKRIEKSGFQAYIVGGCVRDSIIGKKPNDWDICTSATPEEIKEIFKSEKTIDVGIEHGTVVVLLENEAIEITTFRIDGNYSDGRRPDRVEFTSELIEDLSRRDFTINAIAYNHKMGIVDYFNGVQDIGNKVIKCVGNPEKRFREDALRIMRALRFMTQLNYNIEEKTLTALNNNKELLKRISIERISVELNKLILSDYPSDGIENIFNMNIMFIVLPFLKKHEGEYIYDYSNVKRCIGVIEKSPKKIHVRLTVFLYYLLYEHKKESIDIIKRNSKEDVSTLKPHYDIKLKITCEDILKKLHYGNNTIKKVSTLIAYYDTPIYKDKLYIKRLLQSIGVEALCELVIIKDVTRMFLEKENLEIGEQFNVNRSDIEQILEEILENKEVYHKSGLEVTGKDLIKLGIEEGILIGKILDELLEIAIKEPKNNEKEKLTLYAQQMYNNLKSNKNM